MALDDETVMSEVRAGDVGRLEVLFDRHQPALVRYFGSLAGNRSLSEDLAQEAFFRVLKYRHTYQPGASFRAWMYQIARNVYADHLGKNRAEVPMPEEPIEVRAADAPADREMQKKQEAVLVRKALASLPDEKREVLILSRFQELKYEEIAAILKCEVGTVKVRVYRAMRELSDRFFALSGERAS
jgi:RNA polymerase sigma factor (sigma-70 family)